MYLSEVTDKLEGNLIRDGEFQTLEYCTGKLKVPFLTFMGNEKFIDRISPYASCILCTEKLVNKLPDGITGIFVSQAPKESFQLIHNLLSENDEYNRPEIKSRIGEGCIIGKKANIAENGVEIGDGVIIEDNVTIHSNVRIGNECIIRSGSVIGGRAYTFAKTRDNGILSMKDLGRVVIGDRVEILSLAHIDKGILPTDTTYIGDDVKIGSLVEIGHGSTIKERTMITAGAVIAGNVYIGSDSWVGVNATVSNRIHIGNNARVSLGSVVTKDVKDGQTVSGNFAIDHTVFLKNLKCFMTKKCFLGKEKKVQ